MTKKDLCRVCLILSALISFSSAVWGQGTTSRVTGTVLDPSGAAVPNATVTLTNEATNVSFTTQTTNTGTYVFDSVQVGTYTITVEKQGFKRFVSKGNVVQINQPATIDVTLEVGEVSEVVTVESTAELVQTSSSGNFGNTLDQRTIQALPIVGVRGRNPLTFINYQPGVNVGANTGGGVHVHGSRDRAFNFTLDGIDVNETSAGGSNFTPLRTNPDMLAEFQVVTSNFTAELGRSSGAQVTMVTRSGTNEFHGSLFEFYQTPRFHANEYENNLNRLPKRQFVQHIFGGSVGGPVFFPRFGEGGPVFYNGRNKTFFFFNFQGLRTSESRAVTSTVLTREARQGIFRYVIGGRNSPNVVDRNGNVLPGVRVGSYNIAQNDPQGLGLDPRVLSVINITPLPNDFSVGDGLNTAGFTFVAPQREAQEDYTVRIDHVINSTNTIFVRYAHGRQDTLCDFANAGWQAFPNTPCTVDTIRRPRNLAASWRTSPSPSITNEFVAGFNRFTFSFNNPDPNGPNNPPFTFGLITDPLPYFQSVYNARTLTTYQFVDNLTYVRGSHTIKGGINFRYQKHFDNRGSIAGSQPLPLADFSTGVNTVDPIAFRLPTDINTTFDRPTLQSLINIMLGRIGNISQGFVAASDQQWAPGGTRFLFTAIYPEYDFYVQDTWKIRPNLTLDYGLRWEIRLSPRGGEGSRVFRPNRPVRVGETPANDLRWVEGKLFDDDWNNFGPTVGLAWDPFGNGKTSLRANYRLAYDRMNTFVLSSSIFQSTPGLTLAVTEQSFGQSGGRLRQGLPTLAPPAGTTPAQLRQLPPFGVRSITVTDPSMSSPQTHQWGLSLQREIGWNTVLELYYIGRRAHNLYGAYDVNQVDIFRNGFLEAFNIVRNGGESQLINDLMRFDTRRLPNETGSQTIRRLFSSSLALGSVAAVAASIAQRNQGGVAPFTLAGFSPFFFQPFPQFSSALVVLDSNDFSTYHAFEAQVQRRFRRGIGFQFGYTLSKSLDTRSFDPTFSVASRGNAQSASSTPFNIYNRRLNYARSDFDRRHSFTGTFVLELPFGSGRRFASDVGRGLNLLIGGWELAGLVRWQSGRPFTVYSGANTVSNVVQSPANCQGCRPDMGRLRDEQGPTETTLYFFDPSQRALFSTPAPGQLGNTGRNFFTGPPFFDLSMMLGKRFRFTENQNLELRVEATNVTNTPSFGIPTATITSSVFGRIRDGVVSSSRKVQFAIKYNF